MEIWSKMFDFELIPHAKGLILFLCILLSFVQGFRVLRLAGVRALKH